MLALSVRKRKVLIVKRENDSGKGRQNLTYYVFTFNYLIKFVAHVVMECLNSSYTSLNLFIFMFNFKLQHCNFCLQF